MLACEKRKTRLQFQLTFKREKRRKRREEGERSEAVATHCGWFFSTGGLAILLS